MRGRRGLARLARWDVAGGVVLAVWVAFLILQAIDIASQGLTHWLHQDRTEWEVRAVVGIAAVAAATVLVPVVAALFWLARKREEWRWARIARRGHD